MQNILNTIKHHSEKIFLIISIILLFLSLIVILVTPIATGYEMSIYGEYPLYFWFFLIFSIFFAQLSLLSTFLTGKKKYWGFSYITILLNDVILLFLPVIRGYYIYGSGDVLTHVGYIKNIINSGFIGNNLYPIDHILGLSIIFISGLDINTVINGLSPFISLLYLVSFYLIAKYFLKKDLLPLALIFSPILIFGTSYLEFSPFIEALLMLPFFIYIYYKSLKSEKKLHFSFLMIILLTFMTFLHPLIAQILIITFIVIFIIYFNRTRFFSNISSFDFKNPVNLILIIAIIFFSWNAYTYLIVRDVILIISWLKGESLGSQFSTYSGAISTGGSSVSQIIHLILIRYGQFIILGLIALLTIICILKHLKKYKKLNSEYVLSLFSPAILFSIFIALSIITFLATYIFDFGRFYPIAFIFALIFIPIYLNKSLKSFKNKKNLSKYNNIKLISLILGLFLLTYFSTFNFYLDPSNKFPNEQVGKAEITGLETFFKIRNETLNITEVGRNTYRVYEFVYGAKSTKINIDFTNLPPEHFNYTNHTSYSESFKQSTYFLLNPLGENFYPALYPEYKHKWKFTPEEFYKLKENDKGVNKIYSNGDNNIFLTR